MATVSHTEAENVALQSYFREGEARAMTLGNRGPARFTADGKLAPEIVEAYLKFGFYVFENVFSEQEVAEIRAEFFGVLDRLPVRRDAEVDHLGRPALGVGLPVSPFHWSKPLGDPFGGAGGMARAPVKMMEGKAKASQPEEVVFIIRAPTYFSDAALRAYAHPTLLGIAATINGEDFVPFSEGFVVKQPGAGAAFAWHQDGTTHWDNPDWEPQIHGFNFMTQLYKSTAANGLWYVPGSHAKGKVDIKARVEAAGGNLLPDAVPLVCNPGDVAISNRQILHGSFANSSDDWRVSLNTGFHPRKSILGVRGRNPNREVAYDEECIRKRSELIGYAIDVRRQRYPAETPFVYQPHVQEGAAFVWNDAARSALSGYYMLDLNI